MKQRTIRNPIHAKGVGIHTGKRSCITLKPAKENTGIVFYKNGQEVTPIKAHIHNVTNTSLCTSIEHDGVKVHTIEHLLSAISGLGIDNLRIYLEGSEVPIMDGSASHFVFMLQGGGIIEQRATKRYVKILEPVEVVDEKNKRFCRLLPYDGFRISFQIVYQHSYFNQMNQYSCLEVDSESFLRRLSRSRTYGFVSDYDKLKQNNLALGANLSNAIAFDEHDVINQEGLRYGDECVKHKILDALGDLYLLGHSIIGHFEGYCSGHYLNQQLLKKLLSMPSAWEYVGPKMSRNIAL
ncbi:MAG TPA: UDP-3-O-acyl-N-acetylglucosamine deacetylase [Gammaproteobacteria bacterium]|nr:UDP-3-O-acyl-N-acetylglucosamine deacetylase [Gammaproteobacteria bacterium]